MPSWGSFLLIKYEDGLLTVPISPRCSIGGWDISFDVFSHYGGQSPVIQKSCSSGYSGVSGIMVTNSGIGEIKITINPEDTADLDMTPHAYSITRRNSGVQTLLTEGFFTVVER